VRAAERVFGAAHHDVEHAEAEQRRRVVRQLGAARRGTEHWRLSLRGSGWSGHVSQSEQEAWRKRAGLGRTYVRSNGTEGCD
jgi:hypothetical protein